MRETFSMENRVQPDGESSLTWQENDGRNTKPLSLAEYILELKREGLRVVTGAYGTCWVEYESWGWLRTPTFALTPPDICEVKQALCGLKAFAGYLREPDQHHPVNAWLYVCQDQSYHLDKLSSAGRRDARRAGRGLRFEFIGWKAIYDQGHDAYVQTRCRIGLSDGTLHDFNRRLLSLSRNAARQVIGAWQGSHLAAFMILLVVDDWVEIQGSFSCDEYLRLCPNNGLADFVLYHFLTERRFRTVSYGLSSVQEADIEGLHAYKQKVGFEARPVHRAFALHPIVAPLAHPLVLKSMRAILRFHPGNRRLRKVIGMLSSVLEGNGRKLVETVA